MRGFAGRVLPLSHQANQSQGVIVTLEVALDIRGAGTRPLNFTMVVWTQAFLPASLSTREIGPRYPRKYPVWLDFQRLACVPRQWGVLSP